MNNRTKITIPSEEVDALYQLGDLRPSERATVHFWDPSKSDYVKCGLPIHYVTANEKLILIKLEPRYSFKRYFSEIVSPNSGFFVPTYFPDILGLKKDELCEKVLGYIFENSNDAVKYVIGKANVKNGVDPFTKKQCLSWEWPGIMHGDGFFELNDRLTIKLDYIDFESIIWISTDFDLIYEGIDVSEIAWDYVFREKIVLHKGDTVSFLFEDGSIIDFLSRKTPTNKVLFNSPVYKEDLEILLNKKIISYRITFAKEGKSPIDGNIFNVILGEFTQDGLHYYLKEYVKTINKYFPDFKFTSKKVPEIKNEYKFPGCYVYLMYDLSNGYYKIGMSNKPEYREKTLQSEKPTIELLACKKFPTRKIAEAIESALHTAYSQQRLRGEWFNLDDPDVAAIIETLK